MKEIGVACTAGHGLWAAGGIPDVSGNMNCSIAMFPPAFFLSKFSPKSKTVILGVNVSMGSETPTHAPSVLKVAMP